MKILLLGTVRWNQHNRQHEYLKHEIGRQHEVCMYGQGYLGYYIEPAVRHIEDVLDMLLFQPDVILTFVGKYNKWLYGLEDCKLPKVHWAPDYVPIYRGDKRVLWIGRDEDPHIEKYDIDLVCCPNRAQVDEIARQHPGVEVRRLPFSVNTKVFKASGKQRDIDVSAAMTVSSRFYKKRIEMLEVAEAIPNSFTVGGTGKHKARIYYDNYIDMLSRSKISLNGTSLNWTDFRPVNPRFFEIPACGALLLTEPADDMNMLGFVPGENCDTFETIDEMKGKIKWYLNNDHERKRVARNGTRLVRRRHSNARRVQQLTKMIEGEFDL